MSYLGQQLGQGQAERFVYTATGGETSVTSDDAGRAIAYTVGQVDVYLNGAKLINGSDFTATTGTSITGLAALTASDVVEVFALSIFQASDTVSAASGGTFNGNVTVAADLSVTGTTTITTADINGGAIDGVTIGGASAAAGSFTTITASDDVNFDSGTFFVDASADAVGIGTSSPVANNSGARTLQVDGGANGVDIRLTNTGTGGTASNGSAVVLSGADFYLWNYENAFTAFGTNNAERMRIDSSGNVDLYQGNNLTWRFAPGSTIRGSISIDSADNITFSNTSGNTERMRIDGSGRLSINTTAATELLNVANTAGNGAGVEFAGNGNTVGSTSAFYGQGSGSDAYVWNRANSPVLFGTNNTERMRIDSSGNLLVGTTDDAPGAGNTNAGVAIRGGSDNRSFFSVSSNYVAAFNRNTNDGNIVEFNKDGTGVGNIGTGAGSIYIGSGSQSSGVSFYGTALYPNNGGSISATNGANDIGAPTARWKDLYLSGGVYLGGTGAANLLDDYEEGTFTPVIEGQTTAGTATYTFQSGRYTKIGDLVHVQITIGWSGHTGTGNMRIASLPFTAISASPAGQSALHIGYANGLTFSSGFNLTMYVGVNSTNASFIEYDGTPSLTAVAIDAAVTEIIIAGTYKAA